MKVYEHAFYWISPIKQRKPAITKNCWFSSKQGDYFLPE